MWSKDTDQQRLMNWKVDNIEIRIGDKTNEIIKELFEYSKISVSCGRS